MTNELPSGLPSCLVWEPRVYQTQASNFLLTKRYGGLILWPGFGKTTIILQSIKRLRDAGYKGKFLIIAPLKVAKYVWPEEATKWFNFADLTVHVLHGKGKRTDVDADIYVTNFDTLPWLLDAAFNRLDDLGITALVIDELSKFKRHSSQRFKLLKPHLARFHYRWGLTGSLMTRHYVDLFGLMYVLDCGKALGSFVTHYRRKYFSHDPYSHAYEALPGAEDNIKKRISPSLFVLPEAEYFKLPEFVESDIRFKLTPPLMKQYKVLHEELVIELQDTTITAVGASAAMNKCLQFVSGNVYDETRAVHAVHTEKLEQLEELIEELNGAQLVIFYWYEFEYQMLLAHFGSRIGFINSQTPEKAEQAAIKSWNKGELELLAIQPASGGHGLNLQGSNARYVVWYSLTNDYDLYDQGNRRVYRSGNQADKVVVFRLIATGTVDEALVKMMARKSFKQAELVADLSLLSA